MTTTAPMTATQKILARACQRQHVAPGEVIYPEPEWVIVHDGFVETAYKELHSLGYGSIAHPERVMFVTDHEVSYGSQRAVERGRNIRQIAKAWHVGQVYDAGRGGHGHIFPMEQGLVRPGMFLFAYDMHCTNFGAVGALAMAAGTEVTAVLATGSLWTRVPETVRIDLQGRLPRGSHARDVGFLLAHGFAHGIGHRHVVQAKARRLLREIKINQRGLPLQQRSIFGRHGHGRRRGINGDGLACRCSRVAGSIRKARRCQADGCHAIRHAAGWREPGRVDQRVGTGLAPAESVQATVGY